MKTITDASAAESLSIIIPAWNASETIAESLASACEAVSSFRGPVEIVVVDDGSTDDTARVVESYFERSPVEGRLVRHQSNRGGGAARNTAVDSARHDQLFCLDADNLVDRDSFARAFQRLCEGGYSAVAFSEIRFFHDGGGDSHSWSWPHQDVKLADPLSDPACPPVASGNYFFTRGAWVRAGGYPEFARSLDAWGFGLRLLRCSGSIDVMPDTFYRHRLIAGSYWTRDDDALRSIAGAQLLLELLPALPREDYEYLLGNGALVSAFGCLGERSLHPIGADVARTVALPEFAPRPRRRAALHRIARVIRRGVWRGVG